MPKRLLLQSSKQNSFIMQINFFAGFLVFQLMVLDSFRDRVSDSRRPSGATTICTVPSGIHDGGSDSRESDVMIIIFCF